MKCGRKFFFLFFVVHFSSKTLPHYNKVGLFGWLYVCDNKGIAEYTNGFWLAVDVLVTTSI